MHELLVVFRHTVTGAGLGQNECGSGAGKISQMFAGSGLNFEGVGRERTKLQPADDYQQPVVIWETNTIFNMHQQDTSHQRVLHACHYVL